MTDERNEALGRVEWWQDPQCQGDLTEIVRQLRQAVRAQATGLVGSTHCFFNALNLAQNALAGITSQMQTSEVVRFERLLVDGISLAHREWLAREPAVEYLARFTPLIMDMRMVRDRMPGYPAGATREQIPKELVNAATGQHRALAATHRAWQAGEVSGDDVLRQLARLLYLVRSNIAHGEKTDDPSDLERWIRDRNVCGVALPAAVAVIEGLFAFPSEHLITTGPYQRWPLSPLRKLSGEWSRAYMNGYINAAGFRWQTHAPPVEVSVFTCAELRNWWAPLDELYGPSVLRLPTPVRSKGGAAFVAQVYEPQQLVSP